MTEPTPAQLDRLAKWLDMLTTKELTELAEELQLFDVLARSVDHLPIGALRALMERIDKRGK